MKSYGDYTDGEFSVKNGDDVIIIKGGYVREHLFVHCVSKRGAFKLR